MTRLRVALVVLAAALLLPLALLVTRALEIEAAQGAMRERAVAERVFDEMERALSDFLAREEARPAGHYRYWTTPEGAAAGVLVRSPLALPPEEAFVLGYFQIDPDGSLHAPLRPRSEEAVRAATEPAPPAAALANAERALQLVRDSLEPSRRAGGRARSELAPRPAPAAAPAKPAEKRAEKQEMAEAAPEGVYDALQRLNRGAEPRAQRLPKLEVAEQEAIALPAPSVSQLAPAPSRELAAKADRGDAKDRSMAQIRDTAIGLDARLGEADAPAATPPRVIVDPMIGRALDSEHLLLQRTLLIGDRGLRQGLVVDVGALGERLRAASLGDGRLPGASAQFGVAPDDGEAAGPPGYEHRFAEPFDALAVRLTLPPLENGGRASTILLLAGFLVLTTAGGLFALDRMVALTVGFAERRSNFVAAVSHELKTPLTAIRMYGEMLRDGMVPTEEKRAEYYRTITAEAERLSRLINNVLEFARLEKGAREMALVAGAIGPVIEELARFLRPHAEAEGFALEVRVDPGLPPVRFERDALLQILFNLVDNAVKYARGAQERRVVIACHASDAGGVDLVVRDFGPGVAGPQLRRVFEPFHRVESELTRSTKGTGLGLALVRGLAERMGAGVDGRNAPGGGFEIHLHLTA